MSRHSRVGGAGFVATNVLFVLSLLALGAWAAWPIYESPSYLVMVAGAVLVAGTISILGLVRSWSWFRVTLVTVGAYLVLGVPLAVPSAASSTQGLPGGAWLEFVTATVFGWKQLVTVTIPVGTYQALLVPAFFLFLWCGVAAFSLVLVGRRLHVLAVPVLFLIPIFGLAFGSSRGTDSVAVGGMELSSPREFVIGLGSLLLGLAFLLWRARQARRNALRASVGIVRQRSTNRAAVVRRSVLALAMVLVAVVASALAIPGMASSDRQVLRTAIDPQVNLSEFVSPLSQFRSYFGADAYDEPLFTVEGEASRLRLAVLSYYDGEVFRVVDPVAGETSSGTAFSRIPSSLSPDVSGGSVRTLAVNVEAYEGVWLPTAGALSRIQFRGDDAAALTDGFFYNATSEAGVELGLLSRGDGYSIQVVVPDAPVSLDSLGKPESPDGMVDAALIPENLIAWARSQSVGSDAAALQELVVRLRERGYLSHALLEPEDAASADWMSALGDYSFEPSLAGHSIDRIDALFESLILKENDTQSTESADLVAAVGDDEQFAVAVALLAQYFGFPSRVVLGFDLGVEPATAARGCVDGECLGQNLMAWVEVAGSNGQWATVDVTPQHDNPVSPLNNEQRDPRNLTDVVPDTATEQLPPEANPGGGDTARDADQESGPDLAWLSTVLKVVGGSLLAVLVLLAPFLTIFIAKARRRQWRVGAPQAEARIVGGWDEYVDAALDHGKAPPASETRTELARKFATPRGLILATMADRAVFHAESPTDDVSAAFWEIVEAEKRSLAAGMTRWQRFRSAISLRSFAQHLGADPARRDSR